MNRQQMEKQAETLSRKSEVEEARVVEFLGIPHVHVDFKNGNIGVISKDDEYIVIPVKTKGSK